VQAALAALSPLLAALPADLRLDLSDAVIHELDAPFDDETDAEQAHILLARAEAFVSAQAVDDVRLAVHLCEAASAALEESRPVVDDESFLCKLLADDVTAKIEVLAVRDIQDRYRVTRDLCANVVECDWLSPLTEATLRLEWSRASLMERHEIALPDAEVIVGILDQHGVAARSLAETWVTVARPSLSEFKRVFEPLRNQKAISSALADAVDSIRATWADEEQAAFLRELLGKAGAVVPSGSVVRISGLAAVPDPAAADLLVDRFNRSATNPQRQAVVNLWIAAGITDDPTRRRLIEQIIIPMLTKQNGRLNKGSAEIAVSALRKLAVPLPHGPKHALGRAMKAAIEVEPNLEKRVTPVAALLGYNVSRGGGWFARKRVSFDAD
jgi:hypothetical protein